VEDMLHLLATSKVADDRTTAAIERASDVADEHCLELCISLLDHDLKGGLFESIIIGFLALLGIDAVDVLCTR
jgi:hypothetical protein